MIGVAAVALAAALAAHARAQSESFDVPDGFRVEDAAPLAESLLALCFDPRGRAIVSVEGGPLLALSDGDGDGVFETQATACAELESCQGLCWHDGALYAVGLRGDAAGLYRVRLTEAGDVAAAVELVAPFTTTGEHGAHAVVAGPDGALYVSIGNQAALATAPRSDSPLREGYEGALLDVYYDPNGQAILSRYPAGYVARVDPRDGSWSYHSVGLRNAYDVAFDEQGELFTCDSDMEWDLGLPWYRPVRALHLVRGGDYGSRTGSSAWPAWYADSLPGVCDIGRGSPTGAVFASAARFPERYRRALFVGDWSQGCILAVHLRADGASYAGDVEVVVRARGRLNVTDLAVGPDGALYFVSGGRGSLGRLQRLIYTRELGGELTSTVAPATPEQVLRKRLSLTLGRDDAPPLTLLTALLASPDRTLRYLARAHLERGADANALDELWNARNARVRVEQLLVLARFDMASLQIDRWCERAAQLLTEGLDDDLTLDALRAVEIGLSRKNDPGARAFGSLGQRALALFPAADPRVSRELALVLGHAATPEALAKLLDALEAASDRAQSIHYAYCAHQIASGWTSSSRRRLLAWFDATETWSGGASFAGYLAAMRARFVRGLSDAESLELAQGGQLGAVTLAQLCAHVPVERRAALVAPLRDAWSRLGDSAIGAPQVAAMNSAARALIGVRAPGLAQLIRERVAADGERVEAVWLALASMAEEADFDSLLRGLELPSADVRRACADALSRLSSKPRDGAAWRRVLDGARRYGFPQGRDALRALAHWRGNGVVPERGDEWNTALASWESWLASQWPDAAAGASEAAPPRWSSEQILAFLERSSSRKGSPARGAGVFAKAACARCHVMEGSPEAPSAQSGFGPELTTVARRFNQRELLEAIVEPSRTISDQYRTVVAITNDERRHEGRLVGESASSITLMSSDGGSETLERSELASLEPARTSFMPEGLLLPLTLEEIKDLCAFLAAEGRVDPADGAGAQWAELFTGKNRSGWDGDAKRWRIDRGLLIGVSDGESAAYLMSKSSYADFEIELDLWMPAGNSGLQYRSEIVAGAEDPRGYQADLGQTYWGSLFATDGRGTLVPADGALLRSVLDRRGWNHVYVRADGESHYIELNGATTVDSRDGAFSSGRLGFQLHARLQMEVRVANARLRPLR